MELDVPSIYITPPAPHTLSLPHIILDTPSIERIKNGQSIVDSTFLADQVVLAFDQVGGLIAILQANEGNLKPSKVFISHNEG